MLLLALSRIYAQASAGYSTTVQIAGWTSAAIPVGYGIGAKVDVSAALENHASHLLGLDLSECNRGVPLA